MTVDDDLMVGSALAGYRIAAVLGRGAKSVVYLAEDVRLKRRVALKVIDADLAADGPFRERFLRESESAAAIDHPNVVPIFAAGESEGRLFIAMRYVPGGDLRARLGRGALAPRDAVGVVAQVAAALDAAHARGLVHRDVKPSNILLDAGTGPDGLDHAYLADFGLTHKEGGPAGAEGGRLVGTIDYVAPEQIAGGDPDGRADVYSLGCLLLECLTGEPPFPRSTDLEVVFAHLDDDPPTVSARRPYLPSDFDAVIATALAKDPSDRYATCHDLATAASAVLMAEASRVVAELSSRTAESRHELATAESALAAAAVDAREMARRMAATADAPTRVSTRNGRGPFMGLAGFGFDDAEFFSGREQLVADMVARLAGSTFLALVGPSGSGKSSVLHAGLLPALADGVLPGSARWRRVTLRPGAHPMNALRDALGSQAADPVPDALAAGSRLLIAVDQLEEVVTAGAPTPERAAFVRALTDAAADPAGRVIVVVALRADFYGRFAFSPEFAGLLGANHVLVGAMHPSELRRAIVLPAARAGARVEPGLVDALIDDVDGAPGALPLLSTALDELWQRSTAAGRAAPAGDDPILTLADYRASGGVQGAVARLAEATYDRVPEEHRPLVRSVLLRLVTAGEGATVVRRRAPLAEFDLDDDPALATTLAVLADSRLVTISQGSVEVAHEALLREWPRLREWIEDDARAGTLRRQVTDAAIEWDAAGRDEGALYRGARLAAVLDWAAAHPADLNGLERDFVGASRDAAEHETHNIRRTNRRLRGMLAAIAAALALTLALGAVAVIQRGQARAAETVRLAHSLGAQALIADDLPLSLLLARQSLALHDTPQTRGYLLSVLLRAPTAIGSGRLPDDAGEAAQVDAARDGTTLAVATSDAGVLLLDASTFAVVGEPFDASEADAVAYSPDGRSLAAAVDGGLVLIDARSHERLAIDPSTPDATHLLFSPDGERLVVVEARHGIRLRDASTLEPIGAPLRPGGFSGAEVFGTWPDPTVEMTPDGRSVVIADGRGRLRWWDLETARATRSLAIEDGPRTFALSPDGGVAAVGLDDGLLVVDLPSGGTREARGVLTGSPSRLVFSPDGSRLVSTGRDGSVTVWEVADLARHETWRGHADAVVDATFSADGTTLFSLDLDGTVLAWDIDGRSGTARTFTFTADGGPSGWNDWHPGAFSPDGRTIAVGLAEDGIGLWDADALAPTGPPLTGTGGEVTGLAFSPDGTTLVAVTAGGNATLWNPRTRALLEGPFAVSPWGALDVAFSADGNTLATAADDGVRLWGAASANAIGRVGDWWQAGDVDLGEGAPLVAFIRTGWGQSGGGTAEVWDTTRTTRLALLEPPQEYPGYTIALSTDGQLVATGGRLDVIHVWDVARGRLVRELEQDVGAEVRSLDFSPDGSMLAASGSDGFVTLWDVETGSVIGPGSAAQWGSGARRGVKVQVVCMRGSDTTRNP